MNKYIYILPLILILASCQPSLDDPDAEPINVEIPEEEKELLDTDWDMVTLDIEEDTSEIVDFAEVEPQFPGGEGEMMKFIQKNVRYPQIAVEREEQGIVYVQFVVNADGSIENVSVVRGVSDALDDEAKRVVRKMPKWEPGEQEGVAVRCRFTLPIHFRMG